MIESPSIPCERWPDFSEYPYDEFSLEATRSVLREGEVFLPFTQMLGDEGVALATRIRQHDFGKLTDKDGRRI